MDPLTVYKSAGEQNEYLITLQVSAEPSNTNLERSNVDNRETAKFRCKKAFVLDITHKFTGDSVESIRSNYKDDFVYRKGEFIEEPNYYTNYENVCSPGIHFFLIEEVAFFWGLDAIENGCYRKWHENGKLWVECGYKNGKLEGPYKSWHENGHLEAEDVYKNGKEEGLGKSWDENGQLIEECGYKNGKLEGPYKSWYENGQVYVECKYKNGEKEGLFRRWDENGQLTAEIEHKNGHSLGWSV